MKCKYVSVATLIKAAIHYVKLYDRSDQMRKSGILFETVIDHLKGNSYGKF